MNDAPAGRLPCLHDVDEWQSDPSIQHHDDGVRHLPAPTIHPEGHRRWDCILGIGLAHAELVYPTGNLRLCCMCVCMQPLKQAGLHGPCTCCTCMFRICKLHGTLACIDHRHLGARGPLGGGCPPTPLGFDAMAEALTQSPCFCSNPCRPGGPAGHTAAAHIVHCNPACGTFFWVL